MPARYPENPSLGNWLTTQRQSKRTGTLSAERITRLEALRIVWNPLDAAWEAQFAALKAFKVSKGHGNVPSAYPENSSLGSWLKHQRTYKKMGTLSAERIARLEALGVVWEVQDTVWDEQFAALQAFHAREGHGNVPARYPENSSLGTWLSQQRVFKKTGTLSPERIVWLEGLGVVWELRTQTRF